MGSNGQGDTIRLTVPASLAYIRVIRLTASAVASGLGFDVEEVEDLRVAVDELASIVIDHAADTELDLTFTVEDDVLRLDGRAPVDGHDAVHVDGLTSQILSAVTDSYEVALRDGSVHFRCTRRLPATP